MSDSPASALAQEVELKFRIPGEDEFNHLLALTRLDDFTLHDKGVKRGEDVYFDTAERNFLHAGFACRLRPRADGAWLVTLKGLHAGGDQAQGLHQRSEVEVSLTSPGPPETWPDGPARTLAQSLAAGDALEELIRIQQTRHVRQVALAGRVVAEMSLDAVLFNAADEPLWLAEIELSQDGSQAELQMYGAALQAAFPALQPEPRSKLFIALALAGAAEAELALAAGEAVGVPDTASADKGGRAPGVRSDDRMSEAGRKTLRFHFRRMLRQEKGAAKGEDIEALHDMRVATRRMRAALKIFEPYFDEDALRPFARNLRRTGRALGQVRDLDVLLDKLQRYTASLPEAERAGLERLRLAWEAQRAAARRAMLAFLESNRYRQFKRDFEAFLTTADAGARPLVRNQPQRVLVCHVAASTVWLDFESIRAYEWVLDRPSLEMLHQLRIEIKGLRYLLEYLREVLGHEVAPVIAELVQTQDLLGDLHDADVAVHLLSDFLTQQTGLPEARAVKQPEMTGVVAYLTSQEAQVRKLRRRVPAAWKRLNAPRLRRQLALAAANL